MRLRSTGSPRFIALYRFLASSRLFTTMIGILSPRFLIPQLQQKYLILSALPALYQLLGTAVKISSSPLKEKGVLRQQHPFPVIIAYPPLSWGVTPCFVLSAYNSSSFRRIAPFKLPLRFSYGASVRFSAPICSRYGVHLQDL